MEEREINMITYGSTTLTSYNTITKIEVYYYQSTSPTTQTGGSWSTTKPTWVDGRYVWQKIRTTYEGKLDNGSYYSESDPVNITGQQGATGTSAYSYKLNASDSIIGKTKTGEYTIDKVTFTATYKQGTGAVTAYTGRFKIETTADGTTWATQYTSSGNESSKQFTIPENIISVRCSLYQSGGTSTLLDITTIPVVKDGIDAVGLRDSIPYYLASDKQTGVTRLDQGWTRFKPELTTEKRYLWVYYVSRYSEGDTQPELIEIKNDIVSFENHGNESPVENCVIDIEPVQDLNGYDSPWPDGGGKNLLYVPTGKTYTENGVTWTLNQNGSITVSGTATEASTFRYVKQEVGEAFNGDYYFQCFPTISSSIFQGGVQVGGTWFSVYASAKTALTGMSGKIQQMWFQVRAGQTLNTTLYPMIYEASETVTEWSPYSNICPITGWTGVEVQRTGKNLFDLSILRQGNFESVATRNNVCFDEYLPIKGGYSYVWSTDISDISGRYIRLYDADKNKVESLNLYGVGTKTFTVPQNATYYRAMWYRASSELTPAMIINDQIELGSTATDYEPYQGETYPITFPSEAGTVYGGTLDVTNGVLTVDRAMVVIDGVNNTVRRNGMTSKTSNAWFFGAVGKAYGRSNFISDRFTAPRTMNGRDNSIGIEFFLPVDVPNTSIALNQWFADNPTQLVYELATPITYQLTPQEITMLCKENNIFADTGQTAISYYDNQTSTDPYVDYSATSAFEYSAEAFDKIDNLQIGGRNLFKKSNDLTKNVWAVENGVRSGDTVTFTIDSSTTGNIRLYQMPANGYWTWEANTDYAMSIDAMADSNGATIYFDAVGLQKASDHIDITTEWKRYYFIVKGTSAGTGSASFYVDNTGTHTVSFRHPKLEKGNKATDWTPAPEDIDDSIDTAQSTADTAIHRATATYGTSSTAAGTAEKAVSCSNFVLFNGARIQVTFTNANTASAPTLNVNSTGAKAIYINKTVTSSSNLLLWTAGSKMEFVYDGTGWIAQNVPYALYGTCSTGASTATKAVTCNEAVICKGTTISVNMTNTNTAANATMNVGSTLAKDIYANGAKLTTNSRFNWRANTVQKFVFDGQVWRMDDDSVKALATAYITEIDEDGIMVHPEDDSNSGWAISDAIQLFKNGISYIKLWIENNIPKIRIGKEDQGHIVLDNDSVDVRNGDDILASFGETSIIGDQSQWHQTIASDKTSFANGQTEYAYISPDKFYAVNAEVSDAFYIGNYSVRNAKDGKLVIGLRRR